MLSGHLLSGTLLNMQRPPAVADIRTSIRMELGSVQCVNELPETFLVSVHLPVSTNKKLPASHDCRCLFSNILRIDGGQRIPVERTATFQATVRAYITTQLHLSENVIGLLKHAR